MPIILYNEGIQHTTPLGVFRMDDFDFDFDYLDSIGYDDGDDDCDYDPDANYGFQPSERSLAEIDYPELF